MCLQPCSVPVIGVLLISVWLSVDGSACDEMVIGDFAHTYPTDRLSICSYADCALIRDSTSEKTREGNGGDTLYSFINVIIRIHCTCTVKQRINT